MTSTSRGLTRRQAIGAGTIAFGAGFLPRIAAAQAAGDIVIGSSSPVTGVFANVGIELNAAMADYCAWRNAEGGIAGRKLRFVWEDSAYKVDESVAIFRKIMAAENPPLYYGDSTGWAKAVSSELSSRGTTMSSAPSFSSDLADPVAAPFYFMTGPTYAAMMGVLLRYIKDAARGSEAPRLALIYSDTEFGRDPIEASKRMAAQLGIEIVAEVITKPGGVDVSPEVVRLRRARPQYVIFHGYVLAPIPEFIRQLKEAGVDARFMGTIWTMDQRTIAQMGAAGDGFLGVMPYRYFDDSKDAPGIERMQAVARAAKPDMPYRTIYYVHSWLTMMIFEEIVRRALAAGRPLDGASLKVALESVTDWDTGGIVGKKVSLATHSIPIGRVYQANAATGALNPVSDWIEIV